ncbi:MAG: AAA family ATPase, partial [Chloroflexota bacterium]|nr:AAA family ATPase [Chloroflexota bacterium]
MRCRACGSVVGVGARFCAHCGTRIDASDRTGAGPPGSDTPGEPAAEARAGRSFAQTQAMVSPVGADRPVRDPTATGSGGDRRIVTALFADLVDYVRLVAEHDAEDVRRRVDAALVAMVDAIQGFDGTREKFIGDAVFAVFGWPVAHDDDALRATHCALAIRAGLSRLEDPAGEALQVRIGIATGEVVAAPRDVPGAHDWSLTGPAVTTAARIQGIAGPGDILLDEATIRATRKGLRVEDLGSRVLRGQIHPVRIGRLLGEAGFQPWQPPDGPFIGRVEEQDVLRGALAAIRDGRAGGTVLVEGDAGMGKSRLLAFAEASASRLGIPANWVDNVSYGAAEPFRFARALAQAVADEHGTDSGTHLRRLLFTPDVDPEVARRWAGGVAAVARDAAFSGWEAEAVLAPSDPADVARDVRDAAVHYFDRLVELDGARVVIVDDLHWLDPSSEGIFEELVRASSRRPLLVLAASRPDPARNWLGSHEHLRRIELGGLAESETGELAAAVAGLPVDEEDVRRLHIRTGGNPLYIGETVRAIVDDGLMTSDGRLAIGDPAGMTVAVTLRALLGSRIDALSVETRTILRVGSVLGMSFHEGMIEEVLEDPVEPAVYERLAEAAMIAPIDARGGWRFCHPLIHDVAYGSLLATDRRALHGRVADRLEARAAAPAIAVVARHRAAAGDADRAIPL